MTTTGGNADVRIGGRLRAARKSRGLTLEQVSGATGLTKGFVSRLERDEVSPSVASLVAVCNAIGLRVGALFDAAESALITAGTAPRIHFGGQRVEEFLLTPGHEQALRVIRSFIEPAGGGGDEPYFLECDVEFVYVIEGVLEIGMRDQTMTMSAGDALTFAGREPHTWRNPHTSERCQVLWVLAPAP